VDVMGEKILLIIAPTLYDCCKTAVHWGFTIGQIDNFRNVTKPIELRSVHPGTPFITFDRENWGKTRQGFDLDQLVATLQRTGKLRIAQDDDIAAHRSYEGVPFRTQTGEALRSAVATLGRLGAGR
jgi:hypothetical protein